METPKTPPPEMPLTPRPRAVVIGASSGIGEALARRLAGEGYLVAVLARRMDALQSLCEEINAEAGETRAFAYRHDVSEFETIPPLFQKILRDLRRIDLLAYLSGTNPGVELDEFSFPKDRRMVEVNLLGGMAWLGQAATLFERMGAGQIVGVSSVAAERGRVSNPGYNASKAGLTTYLEALRNRLTRKGVNVLTVHPGFVDTAMLGDMARGLMVISTDQASKDIWKAIRKRRQLIYTPKRWRLIMFIVRNIPSAIFRRLSF